MTDHNEFLKKEFIYGCGPDEFLHYNVIYWETLRNAPSQWDVLESTGEPI